MIYIQSQLIRQFSKFLLVGVVNTTVDFLVTNLLYYTIQPDNNYYLMAISVMAASAAALNSFFMNKYWTFKKNKGATKCGNEISKFITIATAGMLFNTFVFITMNNLLEVLFNLEGFLNINLSRVMAVCSAMVVTFIGYKVWVFSDGEATKRDRVNQLQQSISK